MLLCFMPLDHFGTALLLHFGKNRVTQNLQYWDCTNDSTNALTLATICVSGNYIPRCYRGEFFGATSAILGRICPLGWNMFKVSKNLGATVVALIVPAVTSLTLVEIELCGDFICSH